MLGFKTGSSAVAFGVIAPWHALFGGPAEGWLVVAFVIVTCTALFASVVSAVECAFLLVRLLLHRPGNPGESGKVDRQKPADQLRRAANGMRTNYRAARRGRSRDEFKSKLGVVFEEADETADWLRYFRDTGMCHDPKLVKEGEELARIFAASVKTARKTYFSTSSTFPLGKVGFPP